MGNYTFTDPDGNTRTVDCRQFLRTRGATHIGMIRRANRRGVSEKWDAVCAETSEKAARDKAWYACRAGIHGYDVDDDVATAPVTSSPPSLPERGVPKGGMRPGGKAHYVDVSKPSAYTYRMSLCGIAIMPFSQFLNPASDAAVAARALDLCTKCHAAVS